jgi:hypothetical protein
MELYKEISQIKTKDDFIRFLDAFIKDFKQNPNEWENNDLEKFLFAMKAWTEDMEGFYINQNKKVPEKVEWEVFANILYASKMYE